MKRRFDTAPAHGTADGNRLAWWVALVAFLIALDYLPGSTPKDPVYHWALPLGGLIQDAVLLGLVLWIAGFSMERVALRQPRAWGSALGLVVCALVFLFVFEPVYDALVHPGDEQHLVPSHWEPRHAAAFVASALVICVWVPIVEELTFRGLGLTLLLRFGVWPAVLIDGVLFGLAHGLYLDLPVLMLFGCVLAWIRLRTNSVIPGMIAHGLLNLITLVAAVTVSGYIRV